MGDDTTHDTRYLQHLRRTFGRVSVPFFGVIICIVTLLLIVVLFTVNAAASVAFGDDRRQPASIDRTAAAPLPSLVVVGKAA